MNQTPDINGDKILIKGYIKADGTKVSSYWRRLPGKALLTILTVIKVKVSTVLLTMTHIHKWTIKVF